jgi:hypothetical protein
VERLAASTKLENSMRDKITQTSTGWVLLFDDTTNRPCASWVTGTGARDFLDVFLHSLIPV